MKEEAAADLALQILRLFDDAKTQGWDLHAFFELVGGDDPVRREAVFDVVEGLVDAGYLESRGADFYTLTQEGLKAALAGCIRWSPPEKEGGAP